MDFSLLLVTYNRLELLKKAIKCINDNAPGLKEIILVDNNSTDGTFEYLLSVFNLKKFDSDFSANVSSCEEWVSENDSLKVSLIRLANNTGGSGGFYTGVKYFLEKSTSEWMWGMDDDAFIMKDAFVNLKNEIKLNPSCKAFWSNCNSDKNFESTVKKVNTWMFVGFCLNKDLIKEIGLPVCDYFIYHDDSEYAERIIRSGYDILKVKNSLIEHGDFTNRKYWSRKIFWKKLSFPEMSDWKLYYYFRNDILKSSFSNRAKIYKFFKLTLIWLKLTFIMPQKSNLVFKALIHGVLGKRGVFIKP